MSLHIGTILELPPRAFSASTTQSHMSSLVVTVLPPVIWPTFIFKLILKLQVCYIDFGCVSIQTKGGWKADANNNPI